MVQSSSMLSPARWKSHPARRKPHPARPKSDPYSPMWLLDLLPKEISRRLLDESRSNITTASDYPLLNNKGPVLSLNERVLHCIRGVPTVVSQDLQFEGFANHNTSDLPEKCGATHLVFNDDIQGTASVVLAEPSSAMKFAGGNLAGNTFCPIECEGNVFVPGQANNAYVFLEFGPGLIMSCTCEVHVHDSMLLTASEALAGQVTQENFDQGHVHPPAKNNRKTSSRIAANVPNKADKRKVRDNILQLLQNRAMTNLQVSTVNDVPELAPKVSYFLLSLFADAMEKCTNLSPEGGVDNDNHVYLFLVKCSICGIIDSEFVRVTRSTRTATKCIRCGFQGLVSVTSDKGTPLNFRDWQLGNPSPLIYLMCNNVELIFFSFLGEWEIYSIEKGQRDVFEFSETAAMDVDPSPVVFSKWHSMYATENEHAVWSICGVRAIIERRNHAII